MNHTYHYHTPEGVYSARGYHYERSARPKLPLRKEACGLGPGRTLCPGCGRGIWGEDDGQPTASGDAKTVAQVDRPNGLGILVTLPDGTPVHAPYGEATVATCPSCNLKPAQRARAEERIRDAHLSRIRAVGVRVD